MRKTRRSAVLVSMAVGALLDIAMVTADTMAQNPPAAGTPYKEINVATAAFALATPTPEWVGDIALPDVGTIRQTLLLLADTQFLVDDVPAVHVRRATFVNDAGSLTNAGQITISFVPDYQRLELHSLRILRGEKRLDRIEDAAIRFLQRERGLEQGVYSGAVTASLLVSDLRVGDILEFSYTLHGQNPVFAGKFVDSAYWDGPFQTALRRVVLTYPEDRDIHWRVYGEASHRALTPLETRRDGMRRLVFEERSLEMTTPEPLTPPDYVDYRWLQFSEFADWQEVAAWADDLFHAKESIGDALSEVVKELQTLDTDEQRVMRALEFVQSEIRYFAVALGESSHRPNQPDIVLQRRYGDCKDKSLLLIRLLRAVGIESRPTLLKIGSRRWLDKALPSPLAFDHAIVRAVVGGETFYLDPTRLGQRGRLDRLGQAHGGTQALVVALESTGPVTIPHPGPAEVLRNVLSEIVTIAEFGQVPQLRIRQTWNGVKAENMRVVFESFTPEQIAQTLTTPIASRYPGAELIGEPQIEDDRSNNVLVVSMAFRVTNLVTERDGSWFIGHIVPLNMQSALRLPPVTTRKAPLVIQAFPLEAEYSFEAHFPEEVSTVRDPVSWTVDNGAFTYRATSTFRGNLARTVIKLQIHADQVAVDDFPRFAEDIRSIATKRTDVIVVGKSDIRSKGATTLGFAETLRARFQESVDRTTQTIESGRLTGADLALALCHRSDALGYLGRIEEALRDAEQALAMDPNSTERLRCRAYARFLAGRFKDSIADYSRAIILGDASGESFKIRGIAKFYVGRLAEAVEDFLRAREVEDEEGRLYVDLWLSWTTLRLQKPLPEDVMQHAAAEARGEWPRPALAMLTGALTPEDVLKVLDSKSGDDRHMALAEGYFYLGQFHAARGEMDKARDYFEKTRELKVLPYLEHIAAGFELRHVEETR